MSFRSIKIPPLSTAFLIISCLWSFTYANITLSVLYFENLSGQQRFAGLRKVFAELLVADLSGVSGLTLVEREQVEKVYKEIALGQSGAVDETTAPKIGGMLGARYLLTGNYTADRRTIIVQYKLIDTQTGVILGSGSVPGNGKKVLACKDALSRDILAQLAKNFPDLKIPRAQVTAVEVSVDQMDDFGTALDLKDKGDYAKAQEVLKAIVGEVPEYDRFKIELSDIEKRIAVYDKAHVRAVEEQKNAPVTYQSFIQVATSYMTAMQYSKLLDYCLGVRSAPPQSPPGSMVATAEMIDYYIFTAYNSLKRWEKVLSEGELFLKKYPSSMYYGSVKMMLNLAINEMKSRDATIARVNKEARPLQDEYLSAEKDKKDMPAFRLASLYMGNQMYAEALLYFKTINLKSIEKQGITGDIILMQIFSCYYSLQNRSEAQKVLSATESLYPQSTNLQPMRTMMNVMAE